MLYVVKGPRKIRKKRKFAKIVLFLFFAAALVVIIPLRNIIIPEIYGLKITSTSEKSKGVQHKCGLKKSCPRGTFAFNMKTGAANVLPPKMCFNGETIMSSSMKNTGEGLNIAVINARTGDVMRTGTFNMWLGDIVSLEPFLEAIEENTLVLIVTFDDGSTKMTDKARGLIAELGSSAINKLAFRDNWVFAGGKGISGKSPFEQHIKNNRSNNKYENWPELLEMEGCLPQKLD
ncbi:hypothetical protein ACEWY4_010897 [Coilia grayii]|uniref:ILEI/PANDER domain-containing protein n=1 Tax=Coilia grayii TaxID=363190 RepID=A0ABD1K399_9TELE